SVSLFTASGDAFIALPPLDDDAYKALAARHPKVRIDGATGPRDPKPFFGASGWIGAGALGDIRSLLRDAAHEAVQHMTPKDWDEMVVAVRDDSKASDHPARAEQVRDAEALVNMMRQMK